MIYLFNSAYRALYRTNVLNTLFLPEGYTNEYRYKVQGTPTHIAPESYSSLKNAKQGESSVIIYIDRFGTSGYVFHPLRLAKFVISRELNEYLHFRVQLDNFIYPRDILAFNNQIRISLATAGLPKLIDNDPENSNDGYYAILAGSIFDHADDFYFGERAWVNSIESLSETRAFTSTMNDQVIFIRADLKAQSAQEVIEPQLRKDSAFFRLLKGTNYEVVLTYRYSLQRVNQSAKAKVDIELDDNLRSLGSKFINIDSHANSVVFPFATKKHLEDNESGMGFTFTVPGNDEAKILGPDRSLQFQIKESKAFWVQVIAALLLFSMLGSLIGVDFSKIEPMTIIGILSAVWPKLIMGIVQTLILYWLFRLIGKKVL
jgi:hypothetical protein